MSPPATVRVLALDGTWESIGSDRAAGICVENLVPEYDDWGPTKCSFDLSRKASRAWPDIGAFAPVDVEIGGMPVWSGRVADTPSQDGQNRVMNVQCDGPQFHLDDDLYERKYVHTKLADWRDSRSFPTTNLVGFRAVSQISTDGAITLMWPEGSTVVGSTYAGVYLDLGANASAKRIAVDWESSNNNGSTALYARATPTGDPTGGSVEDAFSFAQGGGTAGTAIALWTQPYRYLHLFMYYGGATATLGADVWFRIKAIRIFTEATYEAAGQSVLKASAVVNDALSRGTLLLNPDRSGITGTGLDIPEYAPDGPQTARQAWLAVDAFHDWVRQVDTYWRPIYKPKPAAPVLELGAWSAGDFNDTSANSSDQIYNRALLTGQTPDDRPLRADRSSVALTLPDRRGFVRTTQLPIGAALPADLVAGNLIADTWLSGHETTPFKGTRTLQGRGAIRDLQTGQGIGLHTLGLRTMELIRFSDHIDPDTGGLGRDGRMTKVTYRHAEDTAELTIDNSRTDYEALMARFAVVTGGG